MFTTRYQERDSISYYGKCKVAVLLKSTIFNHYQIVFYNYCLALNRPDAKDTDIESIRDTLVDSLFSFLVTLGKLF